MGRYKQSIDPSGCKFGTSWFLEPLLMAHADFQLSLFPVSQVLGHDDTLTYESWPEHDETLLVEDNVKLPVQVQYHLMFAGCTTS